MNKIKDINLKISEMQSWLNKSNGFLEKKEDEISQVLEKKEREPVLISNYLERLGIDYRGYSNIEEILIDDKLSDEIKVFLLTICATGQSINENTSKFALEGYLLFLAQNYEIEFANIVAYILFDEFGESKFLDQFIQFILLNTDFDGSVGLINPLRNSIDESEISEWKYRNTYSSKLFLSHLN